MFINLTYNIHEIYFQALSKFYLKVNKLSILA